MTDFATLTEATEAELADEIAVARSGATVRAALSLVRDLVFENPPASLTAAQQAALRTLLGTGAGAQTYFPVPDSGVGGTANAITLTTGESISALTGGMLFFFNSTDLNTGAVTVAVDGLAARPVQRSRYRVTSGGDANTGSEPLQGGEITSNDPIMVVYGSQFNEFYLLPSRAGTAAYRNIGTSQHEVPALGSGGVLDAATIPDPADDTVSPGALQADSATQKTAFRARLQTGSVNDANTPSDIATTLTVGGTTYSLPDDVEDVTDAGLPTLTEDNYRQIFIDHDTPRVWVGHREIISAVDAVGTFSGYTNSSYRGVVSGTAPPSSLQDGQFYYALGNHGWWRGVNTHGIVIGRQVSFRTLFATGDWLGEQPDDATAAGLVDDFDANRDYLYYSVASGDVERLDNTTYVAATDRIEHFTAEPISSPNVIGTVTGITAGAGLTGGGSSGQVSLDIDAAAADFPLIGIDKGGTGAATAAAALAALGAAGLVSPTFTGTPLAPTAASGTSNTQIASTAFVVAAIASAMLTGGADGVLASADLQPDGVTLRLTLSNGTEIDVNLTTLISGLITAITTADGSGLTGGADSGTATLAIAARGVTLGMLATGTAGRFIGFDGSGAPTELRVAAEALFGNADTWHPNKLPGATAGAQGAVQLASNAEAIAGTDTERATTPANVAAAVQAALEAAVTGNTETGIVVSYNSDGTLDFVVGATPTPTHTSYVGVSTDTTITAAEANAGTVGTGNALAIPAFTGDSQHVFFARPTSEGDFTAVYLYADGARNTNNQIGSWSVVAVPLDIGGEDHSVIYSTAAFSPASSGFIVEVV